MLNDVVQAIIHLAFLLLGYLIGSKQLKEVKEVVVEKVEEKKEEFSERQIEKFIAKTVKKEEQNVYVPEDEYFDDKED